jgi:hypothetical protein
METQPVGRQPDCVYFSGWLIGPEPWVAIPRIRVSTQSFPAAGIPRESHFPASSSYIAFRSSDWARAAISRQNIASESLLIAWRSRLDAVKTPEIPPRSGHVVADMRIDGTNESFG